MTIMLEIPQSQERELREAASRHGQDPEAYLLSLLDEALLFGDMEVVPSDDAEETASAVVGIQKSLNDFAAGRHEPAAEVFAALDARYGLVQASRQTNNSNRK